MYDECFFCKWADLKCQHVNYPREGDLTSDGGVSDILEVAPRGLADEDDAAPLQVVAAFPQVTSNSPGVSAVSDGNMSINVSPFTSPDEIQNPVNTDEHSCMRGMSFDQDNAIGKPSTIGAMRIFFSLPTLPSKVSNDRVE